MLAVADGLHAHELGARQEQRDTGVAEAEWRETSQLFGQLERQRRSGHSRVDPRHGPQVVVREVRARVRRESLRERIDRLGPHREARRRPMATESLEMVCARRQAGVEVVHGQRAPRSFPLPVRAGDHHHRPAVSFDQPRGDDADHALVPPLVGEHVAARTAA